LIDKRNWEDNARVFEEVPLGSVVPVFCVSVRRRGARTSGTEDRVYGVVVFLAGGEPEFVVF